MTSRTGSPGDVPLRDTLTYRAKRLLLGRPLVTERLAREKLDNRTALGVLASDCISSTAYGSEQMLRVLVPVVGIGAFTLLMPVTGAILLVLLLLTLSYSDVVMIYTRAGGSYVVTRENFGPNVAQIASVALLVDYIVTVAVQTAAGTDALISLAHLVGSGWTGIDHFKLARRPPSASAAGLTPGSVTFISTGTAIASQYNIELRPVRWSLPPAVFVTAAGAGAASSSATFPRAR